MILSKAIPTKRWVESEGSLFECCILVPNKDITITKLYKNKVIINTSVPFSKSNGVYKNKGEAK